MEMKYEKDTETEQNRNRIHIFEKDFEFNENTTRPIILLYTFELQHFNMTFLIDSKNEN